MILKKIIEVALKKPKPIPRPLDQVGVMETLELIERVCRIGNSCVTPEQKQSFKQWFCSNPNISLCTKITIREYSVARYPKGYLSSDEFIYLDDYSGKSTTGWLLRIPGLL